jgi:hypothetical protein
MRLAMRLAAIAVARPFLEREGRALPCPAKLRRGLLN